MKFAPTTSTSVTITSIPTNSAFCPPRPLTFNHGVEGSSPSALTNQIKYLQLKIGFNEKSRDNIRDNNQRFSALGSVQPARQGRGKQSADHAGSRTGPDHRE